MIINFDRNVLINALNISMRAVATRTTMSILECILIKTSGDKIIFTSNDNETAIETTVSDDCEIIEEGKTAVDARLFMEIVKKIDGERILLEKEGSVISITSPSSEFKIQEKDADQFPVIPALSEDVCVSVGYITLKKLIQGTIFSISSNDSNKMMTGEFMEIKGDHMRLASLDGHRISLRSTSLRREYGSLSAIIPGKALLEISRIIGDDAEKEVNIYFDSDYIMFKFDETCVTSRLIDGEYFRIDAMISDDYETKITVDRREFVSKLEEAYVMVLESDRRPLVLNIRDNEMNLKLNSSRGSHNSSLLVSKTGKDLMIGFNPRYLLDAMRAIGDDQVSLYFTAPKAPCYIRDDEGEYNYVIVPITFNPSYY